MVAPRFDGFIDKVGPVTSGTHVSKGEPLMTVFGQELLNARRARLIVEEVTGWKGQNVTRIAPQRRSRARVVGARRRLDNFGVPEEFIERDQDATGEVPDTVSWPAPRDGVVLERNAVDGQGFKAGDVLFRIADHSVVWVMADVAEGDLGAVKPGQSVKVTTRPIPAASSRARWRGLSAPDEGNAHGARAHRAAQSRPRAAAGHVCGRGYRHGLR